MNRICLVCYPAQIAGDIVNRYGLFNVTFHGGQPVSAAMMRTVGFHRLWDMQQMMADIADAAKTGDIVTCTHVVNLDDDDWDGTLVFEPAAIVI